MNRLNLPKDIKNIEIQDILDLDVKYPGFQRDIKIPNEWLPFIVSELRKNLEYAEQLETEIGGYGLLNISPIIPDDKPSIDPYGRMEGLSGFILMFTKLFSFLKDLDIRKAQNEFASWPQDDNIFCRLRIWTCGDINIVSAQNVGRIIKNLSDFSFWDRHQQRDLLIVLAKRWKELDDNSRSEIESRLLKGRNKWNNESDDEYQKCKAWESLNRIVWLANNGCKFTFNYEDEIKKIHSFAPEWKIEYASKAADSMEMQGGFVTRDLEYSMLLDIPIKDVLVRVSEMRGREDNFLIEKDLFAGLSMYRPVRAFSALTYECKHNNISEWAWNIFLYSEGRLKDKPRFIALIAERISKITDNEIIKIINSATHWIQSIAKRLASNYPDSFEKVISKIIEVIKLNRSMGLTTIIVGGNSYDWASKSINSPVGKIAQALLSDIRLNDIQVGGGFPGGWISHINNILSLDDDLRRYAIVIFSHRLDWFYAIDPIWTEHNLLSIIDGNDEGDNSAFWSGFLWGGRVPDGELYKRIKKYLLNAAVERSIDSKEYTRILAGIILSGWASIDEETHQSFITNDELRSVLLRSSEQFRLNVLDQTEVFSNSMNLDETNKKHDLILKLLQYVWPREKSVKTAIIAAYLSNYAFENKDYFEIISKAILPFLSTIDNAHVILPELSDSRNTVIDLYPKLTLDILYAILPENTLNWPYNFDEILKRIGEADEVMKNNQRFVELKRKWDAR